MACMCGDHNCPSCGPMLGGPDPDETFLMIHNDGRIETRYCIPDDALQTVDNGHAEFVRFDQDDGIFQRLTFEEVEGMADQRAVWKEI